jgi:hypothetical protein
MDHVTNRRCVATGDGVGERDRDGRDGGAEPWWPPCVVERR